MLFNTIKPPNFDVLHDANLNCLAGVANFLNVLRNMPNDAEFSLKKEDRIIHVSYHRPYPNSSGIFYRQFEL